ncbi:retron Eco8 family effector endonuclease [Serratia liquefaciens]|uniref:retron Eco8 family effector endonuclease n=1 Tax=Serratia liquefaciens TaxID=614 RepID=UPI003EC7DDB0
MTINSIRIENLLSFDELIINDIKDINCVIGRNNTGKSNLLKLLKYFYNKLEGVRCVPPDLNSKYSSLGTITIEYDLTRIKRIVTSGRNGKTDFFKHIYNNFFKGAPIGDAKKFFPSSDADTRFKLKLTVNSDDSIYWSTSNESILKLIAYLFPFFEVETRHIDLYDWDKIWMLVSRLKSFKVDKIKAEEIIEFIDDKISANGHGYKDYVSKVQDITKTSRYSYKEKVLNYVRIGLKGQKFLIDGNELTTQSDGTNSHQYLEMFVTLLISLTRREYISPLLYIDEPETGLHPKANEALIYNLYKIYSSFEKSSTAFEKGKYATPYPKMFFSTHSPNITKYIIKLFLDKQQILHFSKNPTGNTKVTTMNSYHKDHRFLNIFSDNESRVYFSDYILFVEGETELEAFSNLKLTSKFPSLSKVEIYKGSSNVYLENMNPNFSKISIPYLYLFDLDKAIQFELQNDKVKVMLQGNGNLFSLKPEQLKNDIKKYQKGYNRNYRERIKKTEEILSFEGTLIDFNKKTFAFDGSNEIAVTNLIDNIRKHLSEKEMYFLNTTFEGCLINNLSLPIFLSWLKHEYKIPTTGLFNRLINCRYVTPSLISTNLRLIFNGKSEILTQYKAISKGKNKYPHAFRALNLTEKHIISKGYITDKTSGWVTKFIDFSIDYIEKNKGDISFEKSFNSYFPELYSIIARLRPDRS